MISMGKKNLAKLLISLGFLSASAWASSSTLQSDIIQSGDGYQLKSITFEAPFQSQAQTNEYYFITSPQGALNASNDAGLPAKERDEVIQELKQGALALCNAKQNCQSQTKDAYPLIVIDKGLAQFDDNASNQQINQYLQQRGLLQFRQQALAIGGDQYSCNHTTHDHKSFGKHLYFPISHSDSINKGPFTFGYNIDGNADVNASATVGYDFKSKLCVPYKVEITNLDANADFLVNGNIQLIGQAGGSIPSRDITLFDGSIANGVFAVGPIPVQYDFHLPFTAGTGDINYNLTGKVSFKKDLNITGSYEFTCTNSSCKKIKGEFSDNGTFTSNSIAYELKATASAEPNLAISVKAGVYADAIWAKVGAKGKTPLGFEGYIGNNCGKDANSNFAHKLGDSQLTKLAIIDAKAKASAYAEGHGFNHMDWSLLDTPTHYIDLLNPSNAFSPLLTVTSSSKDATVDVGIRSCVSDIDSTYQNFTYNWGDGTTGNISNVQQGEMIKHTYDQPGTYTVTVTHQNGAASSSQIDIK
ncbi:PKD domain-containing protein [Parashewanella tropica]|uniref:PKD domain-containing protein n=1 Tax=Parashewanella tropica TaxID=2547970 RepID=UPI00147959C3|nr:PKD domain-containing protein [Parashewanella tropica]